jgi:hypothetical protein
MAASSQTAVTPKQLRIPTPNLSSIEIRQSALGQSRPWGECPVIANPNQTVDRLLTPHGRRPLGVGETTLA